MSDSAAAGLVLMKAAARRAGAAAMRHFGSELVVQHKAPGQPVTIADLEANSVLHADLIGARPDYGWLSEETHDSPDRLERGRVWIVDPIDGTRSFVAVRPEFTVSIGLTHRGTVEAGVVYNPARDELFAAVRGAGAHVELQGRAPEPLRVREPAVDRDVTLLASRSEIAAGEFEVFRDGWRIEPAGSTAYKLACIAWGRGDAFISRGPKSEWDICAGVLIVVEAGGRATDLHGSEPRFNNAVPYVHGIVATSGAGHEAVLRRVNELPPPARLAPRVRDPLHPGEVEGDTRWQ